MAEFTAVFVEEDGSLDIKEECLEENDPLSTTPQSTKVMKPVPVREPAINSKMHQKYNCTECNHIARSKGYLVRHMTQKHSKKETGFELP